MKKYFVYFVFWTVGWTKHDIQRCQIDLWEIISMFHYYVYRKYIIICRLIEALFCNIYSQFTEKCFALCLFYSHKHHCIVGSQLH